jgi:F0F1-type ATP synthase epsilon subunit
MAEAPLRLSVRTPRETVAELDALSLRLPTDTGQVGLRPRCEPAVLALEAGLALVRTTAGLRFLATAGGVLRCDGRRAVVLTPIAVLGDDAAEVRERLEQALAVPSGDLELRRAIERLEKGIRRELRRASGPPSATPEPAA